jgi:N-dimethylarginine dimethylaminohydrolase
MCPPPHFGVQYVINPWMEGQIDSTNGETVHRQWNEFHDILRKHAEVALLPAVQGLPDLVFTANAALIYREAAVLSNFRCRERQPEAPYFANWLSEDGFKVFTLPPDVCFEGAGDALLDRDTPLLWLGHGFRSDLRAKGYLEEITGIEVQPIRLIDPRFYHLDTCFCPLNAGNLLYFPGAFDEASNRVIESRVPESNRLALGEQDAIDFACNAVNIGSKVILNNATAVVSAWLADRGFETIRTQMGEFMKAGGSAKCLSLRLNEG